jgi:peptide/nickel transport system substrate-binding protein
MSPERISRRDLLRMGGSAAVLLGATPVLSGFAGRQPSSAPRAAAPKSGGTLHFGRSVQPTQLDPGNSIIAGDVYTLDKIFEPLYITSATGKLVPWLAHSHTVSPDGLSWTFNLRPGVTFSDGSPLTGTDVVFSILRTKNNADGPLSFLDGVIKSASAPSASSVVFELSQPWVPFLSDISVFANGIMPANYGGKTEAQFLAAPVGTGPFLLPSFSAGASLVLQRNPHYWQAGKPYVDEVAFSYITDDNQRVLQLQSGQVDVIDSVPPSSVAQLTKASGIKVTNFPAWEVDLLVFNEKLPKYADRHVRRAIAQALDLPAITKAITFGTSKPAGSFFPPSLQFYDPDTPTLGFSLAKAKAELAKSKFPHGFSTSLLISAGDEKYSSYAQAIQASLEPLGIKVKIISLDHAAFETTFQKFDYEMFIDYAINDISDCDEMASFELDFKDGGSSSYWSSYNNPAVIKLVHSAEAEFNTAKRAKLYSQIQAAVAADAPFVPLDYPPYIYGTTTKVNGFAVNPGGAYRLEDVWLA